jgi:predicted patatin/cPLA2 family phospholipase
MEDVMKRIIVVKTVREQQQMKQQMKNEMDRRSGEGFEELGVDNWKTRVQEWDDWRKFLK